MQLMHALLVLGQQQAACYPASSAHKGAPAALAQQHHQNNA
jgi:hypothetical protein